LRAGAEPGNRETSGGGPDLPDPPGVTRLTHKNWVFTYLRYREMMNQRPISIDLHNGLVLATAPLMMIVPFLLTFDPAVGLLSFLLGSALMGVALAAASPSRRVSLSAIAGFNWTLGLTILSIGMVSAIFGDQLVATIFLVGFGAAYMALTAATRYSARGA